MRILVTGATGILGRHLLNVLQRHDVVALSRHPRPSIDRVPWRVGDLATGAGLADAVADADAVVHAATHPFRTRETDVDGLARLLDAAPRAWFLYPSIVGVDRVPFFYYRHKLAAERLLERRGARHTIVRFTQFHEFVDRFAGMPLPVVPRHMRCQLLAAAEAAQVLAGALDEGSTGRLPDVGGPEVHDLATLVRERRAAAGRKGPVLRVPFRGAAAFRAGLNLCPDRRVGRVTWAEYAASRPPP